MKPRMAPATKRLLCLTLRRYAIRRLGRKRPEWGSFHQRPGSTPNANITNYSLTDFSTLIDVAKEKGYVQAEDLAKLAAWRENPTEWGK